MPRAAPPSHDPLAIKQAIFAKAEALGFCAFGVMNAPLNPEAGNHLETFLRKQRHGDMQWLKERKEQRRSPEALWSEAKSVIALGYSYAPDHDPRKTLNQHDIGNISV